MLLDLRSALRGLARTPGFFIGSVLTLALGLGAVTTAFGLLEGALGDAAASPGDDRVVLYLTERVDGRDLRARWPYAAVRELRSSAKSFQSIANYTTGTLNLTIAGESSRADVEFVSPAYFDVIGVAPVLGRAPSGADDGAAATEVVIGFSYWQRAFAGSADVLGQSIRLSREALTIVGVMPIGVRGLSGRADLWVPHTLAPRLSFAGYLTSTDHFHNVIATLAPGVTLSQARSELDVFGKRLAVIQPPRSENAVDRSATAVPLREAQTNAAAVRTRLFVSIGAVLVLLVAAVNLANLVATRVAARRREFGVRVAVGAGRWHVARSVVAEMLVVAVAGFALAMLAAAWTRDFVVWLIPASIANPANDYGQIASFASLAIDRTVTGMVALLALGVMGLTSTLAARPTWRLDLVATLRSGGDRASTRGPGGSERVLLAVQVAASISLVASAALILRSVRELDRIDPGFNPSRVVAFSVAADLAAQKPGAGPELVEQLLNGLAQVPGVESLTVGQCSPFGSRCARLGIAVEGRPETERDPLVTGWHRVGPGHFATLGIPVIRGRDFTADDRRGRTPVVAINQTAARRFFADQDPIGRRIRLPEIVPGEDAMAEIVAIVGDVIYWPLDQPPGPDIYQPALQFSWTFPTVMARVTPGIWREGWFDSSDASARQPIFDALRRRLKEIDPDLPMFDPVTLDALGRAGRADRRFVSALLSACALLSLALAAVGIYSLTAGWFLSRQKELGVRLALGASPRRLVGDVMTGTLVQTAIGIIGGVAIALGAGRLLQSLLFGIGPNDPVALSLSAVVMLSVAVLAAWVPARRTFRIDPAEQLRAE